MKKRLRIISLVLVLVMVTGMLSGCFMADEGAGDKSLLDDFIDILDSIDVDDGSDSYASDDYYSDDSDDLISALFDAFFGGSSDDYGMGESSYSGGNSNYTGASQTSTSQSFSDISDIPAGSGSRTVLIYMIGSNLETENGCATMDIQEMCEAGIGKNVNVIIEAGGAKKWQNSVIKANKLGRYKVENDGITVVDTQDKASMVDPQTLADFIKWGTKKYPADSYDFIFWNHGGGTLAGFGMDELFKGELSIGDMASAFKASGVHFDFIGFDACLMGTVETAYAFSPYASYLIAAEEEEPGYGWYYTNWLKAVEKNPKLGIERLGKIIVDDFSAHNKRSSTTLSVIDLSKVGTLYKSLCELCASGKTAVSNGQYKEISSARSKSKNFGEGNYDQIDIIDFCNRCGLKGADKVITSVNDCIVYHKSNIKNANGLAMYFPYQYPGYYKQMKEMLKDVGMTDSNYNGFFNSFLSAKQGGSSSSASSLMSYLTGYSKAMLPDFSDEEWYDEELVEEIAEEPLKVNEDGLLEITQKDDNFVLQLSDEDWDKIVDVAYSVFVDDGEGYIDLGYDNILDDSYWDNDNDMIIDFDYLWISIDDNIVPFYMEGNEQDDETDEWFYYGVTPALLTSARTGETRDVELVLYWDNEHEGGYVKGYRDRVDTDEPTVSQRNLVNFIKGDVIDFVCDYYKYDGGFEDEYIIGDELVIDHEPVVDYCELGDYDTEVCAVLWDVYGNEYWTESISIELEE